MDQVGMRVEITIAASVPRRLKETLARGGFTLERRGGYFSVKVGESSLRFDQVTVRIDPDPYAVRTST